MTHKVLLTALLFTCSLGLQAGQLPCQKPGTERWSIKTSLPASPKKVRMTGMETPGNSSPPGHFPLRG